MVSKEIAERAAGAEHMGAQERGALADVALSHRRQDGAVLFVRAVFAVGERELHPEIPVGLTMEALRDGERDRAVGGIVER